MLITPCLSTKKPIFAKNPCVNKKPKIVKNLIQNSYRGILW